MNKLISLLLCLALALGLAACGQEPVAEQEQEPKEPAWSGDFEPDVPTVDVGGQTVVVDETLEKSGFSAEDFSLDEATGRVICLTRSAYTGIDVSAHQGEIDWAAVAGDGIDFAILRIGYRGYTQGGLNQDASFGTNYDAATENGLKVGAYFFSQAISVEEAVIEADFVLAALNGRSLDLPIVFDWELITAEEARTDVVDRETCTACAAAFCQRIEEAGYRSAVYFNGIQGYLLYDLTQLQHLDAWYAEYGSWPSFAYIFDLWQYSKTGTVAGISGDVDLNLWFPEE